mmetsp:Transcript_36872/g.113868  ORF Transcript_36872/g.113868 Transcript_36872/m.113868 type:complete len:317 (-) Transcript_36872:515-1465(-)
MYDRKPAVGSSGARGWRTCASSFSRSTATHSAYPSGVCWLCSAVARHTRTRITWSPSDDSGSFVSSSRRSATASARRSAARAKATGTSAERTDDACSSKASRVSAAHSTATLNSVTATPAAVSAASAAALTAPAAAFGTTSVIASQRPWRRSTLTLAQFARTTSTGDPAAAAIASSTAATAASAPCTSPIACHSVSFARKRTPIGTSAARLCWLATTSRSICKPFSPHSAASASDAVVASPTYADAAPQRMSSRTCCCDGTQLALASTAAWSSGIVRSVRSSTAVRRSPRWIDAETTTRSASTAVATGCRPKTVAG